MTFSVSVLYPCDELKTIMAYLYDGVTASGKIYPTFLNNSELTFFETPDLSLALRQADRLASGMYGARVCADEKAKLAIIDEFKVR